MNNYKPELKPYFFHLNYFSRYTGNKCATQVGVVWAASLEEAENKAWAKYGNDYAAGLEVCEVGEDGTDLFIPL